MRVNKVSIFITGTITVLGLLGSIGLYFLQFNYISNLLSGVFASGLLTLIMSIIGYFVERRKTLEKFYSYMCKVIKCYNEYKYEGDVDKAIDSVLLMNQFDYLELDNAYGEIAFFLFNKKKQSYIYNHLYKTTLDLRRIIEEKSYHFRIYKDAIEGNKAVMILFINEIDKKFMTRTKNTLDNENKTIIETSENCIVKELQNELLGKYYRIMYPYKRRINNAD